MNRHRIASLLRVRDWRVQTKLAAMLAIPTLAFLIITGVQVAGSMREADDFDRFVRETALGRQVTQLVHDLQRERDHTLGYLAMTRGAGDHEGIGSAMRYERATVDMAATSFITAIEPLLDDPRLAAAYRLARADLDRLWLARQGVDDGWLRMDAVFDQYSHTIVNLTAIIPTGSGLRGESDLAPAVRAFGNLAALLESGAQLRGTLFAVCSAGMFTPEDYQTFVDLRARQSAGIARFRAEAAPDDLARFDEALRAAALTSANPLESAAASRAWNVDIDISPGDWWQASTVRLELIYGVQRALLDDLVTAASGQRSDQGKRTVGRTALAVATITIALLLSYGVGRSMAHSLRTLRSQSLAAARYRLPRSIAALRSAPAGESGVRLPASPVRAADEIGEVSHAFTTVQCTALRLAAEDAAMRRSVNGMLASLALRSQALVDRQLALLDQLETIETDPEQLGNLFQLDHLASRLRRTDRNLLVLADAVSNRQWTEPVALSAVVQAAVGEIEHYTRVRHSVASDASVVGHAVSDIAHLLAELLENATAVSPADTTVNVTGRRAPDGGAVVIVEDHGPGMTPESTAEANARVAAPAKIDVAACERMGLVVVGHLAARHRVRVRFRASSHGVTACVALPAELLVAQQVEEPLAIEAAPTVGRPTAADSRHPESPSPEPEGPMPIVPGARRWPDDDDRRLPRRTAEPTGVPTTRGRHSASEDNRWWTSGGESADTSPDGTPIRDGLAGRSPVPEAPVVGGTSTAGLPMRIPMAQLPEDTLIPARGAQDPLERQELDPMEVSTRLSAFSSGVNQAAMDTKAMDTKAADTGAVDGGSWNSPAPRPPERG